MDLLQALKGPKGDTGKSVLELARENGVIGPNGTLQDLLNELRGKDGLDGLSAYELYREEAETKALTDAGLADKDVWLAENEGKTEADFEQAQKDAITAAEDANKILDQSEWLSTLKGQDGLTPTIGNNGNWFIGETDTGVKAEGQDGLTPHIGENGNWFIGTVDTGVKAQGEAGQSAYDIYHEQAEDKVLADAGLADKDAWLAENEGKTEADFEQAQKDAITAAEDANKILDQSEWLASLNGQDGASGSADLVTKIELLSDENSDGKITADELSSGSKINVKVHLGEDAKVGDTIKANGIEYKLTDADISNKFATINNVPVLDGFNFIKVDAQNAQKQTDVEFTFFDVDSSVIGTERDIVESLTFLNDINEDGSLNAAEMGGKFYTSLKVTLGEDAKVGDIVSVNGDRYVLNDAEIQAKALNVYMPVREGLNPVKVTATDEWDNVDSVSSSIIVGTLAPSEPMTAPEAWDNVESIVGPIKSNGKTNDNQPEIKGSGRVEGEIITLTINGEFVVTDQPIIVGRDGTWSYTPTQPLNDAEYVVSYTVSNSNGVTQGSSPELKFTVDTQTASQDAVIRITEIEGEALFIQDQKQTIVVNESQQKDGKITIQGDVSGIATAAGDALKEVVVSITNKGVTQQITVVADEDGKWTADVSTTGLKLEHGDQPSVQAIAVIVDDAGNTLKLPVTEGFTLDIQVLDPASDLDGLHVITEVEGTDFKVDASEVEDGYVTVKGQIAALPSDVNVTDLTVLILVNGNVIERQIDLTAFEQDQLKDGFLWTKDEEGNLNWSLDLDISKVSLVDGVASINAVAGLKDTEGNTLDLNASREFNVDLALTVKDLKEIRSNIGETKTSRSGLTDTFIEIAGSNQAQMNELGDQLSGSITNQQQSVRLMSMATFSTEGEPESTATPVKSQAIGQIRAEFTNLSLLTVAKAYGLRLEKLNAQGEWELVMSAPLTGNGVIASLGTQYALGAVENGSYVVTFNGVPEGDYRVIPYKSASALAEALNNIELANLGDDVLLGEENQQLLLDFVADTLAKESPSTEKLTDLLKVVLGGVNLLTTPVAMLVDALLSLPVIKEVVGLADDIVDKVAELLLSNTLGILERSELTVEYTSYFYEDSERSGNVLANDFNKVLDELSIVDVSNQLGQVYQFISEDKAESVQLVGQHGILTIAQDGSYTYKLNPSAHAKDAQGNLIGKTDVFTYTATNGKLTHQNTLTIDINGGAATEIKAYDDVNHLTLAVDPSVESQPLVSKSIFNVAYVGLGSVLDLGAINPANRFEINVAENTERLITFKAETGGVQVLADFDLFIYKYDEVTKQYKLDDQVEGWFGAALLGGVSEELTKKLDAGQYIVLLEPSRGINALFGYTLETTRDLLLDYVKPISVAGQATGNVISDVNKDNKVDLLLNPDVTYVISAKSVTLENSQTVMIHDDQNSVGTQIVGKYGTLTLFTNGEYAYTASETKNFNYGDIDRFEYTIYDPILGQISQANLDITLNLHDVELDVDTVIAHMNIEASELTIDFSKTYIATDPQYLAKQELLGDAKPSATSFGVAGVGLGNVLDANVIGSSNALNLNVGAGKVIETVFSATGTSAVGVAAISDFAIYKLNEKTNQWELYHFQDKFLIVPLSVLGIPLGGIHNDPLTLALTEGQYKAFLTDRGVKVLGGSTLKLDSAVVADYYKPKETDDGYEYEAIAKGRLIELEADQIEIIQVDGQKFTGESLDIKGEFGTLTVAKDGSYTYTADTTSQKPNYGAIDTFTYVYKDLLTGEIAVSAINVKIGSVDAQRDVLDINGQPSSTQSGMILRHDDFVNQKVTFEQTDNVLATSSSVRPFTFEFTIAPHSQHSSNNLMFKLEAEAVVQKVLGINVDYDVRISYELVRVTVDSDGNRKLTTVDQKDTTVVDRNTLVFDQSDLEAGYYYLDVKFYGVVGSEIKYQYEIKGTQDYQDRWMADPDYNYAHEANVVKGNLLDNDIFSEGLKDQTILKVGNKVLSLDPVVGAQTITVEGLYGTFVIDKSGAYTYTPNGQGGGREIMTYELISPTGETDKSTIEIDVAKIVKGSNIVEYVYSDSANDVYTMGDGSDTVIFDLLNQHDKLGGNGHDIWTDFTVGDTRQQVNEADNASYNPNADKIDISALLADQKSEGGSIDLAKFVSVEVKDGHTIISIDRDGETVVDDSGKAISGNQYAMTELLTLNNVETTLADLLKNNQIIY
ncbi:BapA/Bap/LapF family large adhesin [Acinetobacter variabilis]|uniref:BapA/Bap/LapF family large adhesin n=1 Tax=Acinetobacter variabilis TaxID=70346 RepID=UPI003AF7C798